MLGSPAIIKGIKANFFLFFNFWRDFLRFLISKVETLFPSDGFSILFTIFCLPKGSLLKLLLSVPNLVGLITGLPGSYSSYPLGTWAGPTALSLLLPYNEAKSWGVP